MSAFRQGFVAMAMPAPRIATFVPYSQRFVAIPSRRRTIATKPCLGADLPAFSPSRS
jgi:hypothetical protein